MMTQKTLLFAMLLVACAGQREWNVWENLIKIVKTHILDCQVLLLIPSMHSSVLTGAVREVNEGLVVITTSPNEKLPWVVYTLKTAKCSAVVFQVADNSSRTYQDLSMLERMGLWKLPKTRVLLVGGKNEAKLFLFHPSLRNTIDCLYLGLQPLIASTTASAIPHVIHRLTYNFSPMANEVTVFRRCLYCKNGENTIQLIGQWKSSSGFHPDNLFLGKDEQMTQLHGHRLRIVAVPYFPYMDFTRDSNVPGTTITAKYSVDVSLIFTFASHLNFTFVMREEPHRSWGLENKGVFTGMMGQLQQEEADFCTIAGPSPGRLKVIDYLRGYPSDFMTVVSLKPSLLPQHLSIIRPFTAVVWVSVFTSVAACGALLWILHLGSTKFIGEHGLELNKIIMYNWGSLLGQSMKNPFRNVSTKIGTAWWLLFCLIITSAFKSSLIAHLTIQGRSRPPDTLDDLVASGDWRWATEPWLLKGVPYEYFSKHPDPVVKKIHKEMEVLSADDALKEVLKDRFSLIDFENYVTIIVASRYTDERGRTPFHISKKTFSIMAAFGWGFRKGAPYYDRFQQLMSRLEDAGIIKHWTEEVIARRIRENRETADLFIYRSATDYSKNSLQQVVLGMGHLQGAFYILFLGYSLALVPIVLENIYI